MWTAVPDGASILWRWWASKTSTSTSSPSVRAANSINLKATLTPTLMLGAIAMGMVSAARRMASKPEGSKPVVPMTMALPLATQ